MTTQTFHEDRAAILAEAESILDLCDAENRAMSSAEQEKYSSAFTKVAKMNREIEAGGTQRPSYLGQPSNAISDEEILPLGASRSRIATPHSGKLIAFSNDSRGRELAFRSAQWIRATLLQKGDAIDFCRSHGMAADVMAAHSGGVNTAGGALVPDELSRTIIRLVESFGVFRRESRVVGMQSDTMNIARRKGGLTSYFIGELAAGTESQTLWDTITLTPKKAMILSRLSTELGEDSAISLIDLLAEEVALAIAEQEDDCGFTGDTTAIDGGMTGIVYRFENETLTGAVDAASGHDTLPEVDLDDLINTMAKLPQYALRNAKWFCSPTAFAQSLLAISASAGGVSMQEMQGGMGPRFMGFPVVTTSKLPSTGTLNDKVMLMFGDLRLSSTMGVRRELRFQVSNERYWETDEIGIRATTRFDIVNHDLGDASTAGPVVALRGNT